MNDEKTEFVLIGSRQQLSKVNGPHITIGDSDISPAIKARNLGVILDSSLSLNHHVPVLFRSASLNPCVTEQIVHSFVTSRLDMGNSLLFGLPQDQITRLQRIQNAAARLVTLTRKSSHITPVLKELHWLPVGYRIVFKLLLIVFNNLAPEYITSLLKPYNPPRMLRSKKMSLVCEPRSKHSWGDRAFSIAAPCLWNALPADIKNSPSLAHFKGSLKTHFMKEAFA